MGAPRVTAELIRNYISEGRCHGHDEAYLAFIQLKRWNTSPVSVQTRGFIPHFQCSMLFLCGSEWLLALLLARVGCDVSEQVSMWLGSGRSADDAR